MVAILTRPRILVIDDEADVQDVVAEFLIESGYEVDTVGTRAEALAAVARHPYDLVISDLRLPGCSGATLAGELRRRCPALADRIIILTGESGATDPALPVIRKPFRIEDVLDAVSARLPLV